MKPRISLLIALVASIQAWAGGEPARDSLLVARGDSCMAQYDYFHALQWYEQVSPERSLKGGGKENLALTKKLATCHFLRADYQKCASLLQEVPADSLGHDALRQLYYSHKALGEKASQKRWGKLLLSQFPMDSEVVADMAQELNLDTPELALELTEAYEAVDSTNILVKRQQADALFFMKRYPEAAQNYERLLQLGDETFAVHYSLGMSYEQLAEGTSPDPAKGREAGADSLLLDKAIGHYSRAVELNDSAKAWPLFHLGAALVKQQRNSEGIHILLMALQRMQPDDAAMFNLHWALAEGYYQNEEYFSAIFDWRNCLKYNSLSLASLYNIAQTYEMLGTNESSTEDAYVDFLMIADHVKEPTPSLQEWIRHAESLPRVLERMKTIRMR